MSGTARSRRWLLGAAVAAAAVAAAGCGTAGSGTAAAPPPPGIHVSMTTARAGAGGAAWAVVEMGGSAAQHNNFWQLFTRGAAGAGWKLATPKGVADNGGLALAERSAADLVTGFVPSQHLTFSPLASSTDRKSVV